MDSVKRTRSEYGGFLPLELNPGQEFFAKYEEYLLRFNSVKASLDFIIKKINAKKIYIPYYYCPSTTQAIKDTEIQVFFYHISDSLIPEVQIDEEETIILLVNYFGVRNQEVCDIANVYRKASIIIDNAHAFYAEPLFAANVYNIYSAKKFFGVPDGSYIVSQKQFLDKQTATHSYEYANYLLITYEEGTNAAYTVKKDADNIIAAKYGCMSSLAIGLLQNVDYERVRNQRIKNYKVVHQSLKQFNELVLPDECVAYQYPLLISGIGKGIKRKLVQEKIYVSTLWTGKELLINGNPFELNMSENAIFIPIDQRYTEDDMLYLVRTIRKIKENINGKEA